MASFRPPQPDDRMVKAGQRKGASSQLTPVKRFTEQQRELALAAVAIHSGNTRAAEAFLRDEEGLQIDHCTLHRWTNGKYADRYAQLRNLVIPEVRARMADRMERLFHRTATVEEMALDELEGKLGQLSGHELSTAVRISPCRAPCLWRRARPFATSPRRSLRART